MKILYLLLLLLFDVPIDVSHCVYQRESFNLFNVKKRATGAKKEERGREKNRTKDCESRVDKRKNIRHFRYIRSLKGITRETSGIAGIARKKKKNDDAQGGRGMRRRQ